MLLIRIQCRFCQCIFHLCRRCYRGQTYCCHFCRIESKREKQRQRQRRYRNTLKGLKNHRQAENRRRQKRQGQSIAKNMDDAGSIVQLKWFISMIILIHLLCLRMKSGFAKPRCCLCGAHGRVVYRFPRRPYANYKT